MKASNVFKSVFFAKHLRKNAYVVGQLVSQGTRYLLLVWFFVFALFIHAFIGQIGQVRIFHFVLKISVNCYLVILFISFEEKSLIKLQV